MKFWMLPLLLLLTMAARAQDADDDWRYVYLSSSLIMLPEEAPGWILDSAGNPIPEVELLALQAERGWIVPDSNAKGLVLELAAPNERQITASLRNGTNDTLKLRLQSGHYTQFRTEVFVQGRWRAFQGTAVAGPGCGVGRGNGRLPPHHTCTLEMHRTTWGTVQLPYRLVMKIGHWRLISNEVRISCTAAQRRIVLRNPRLIAY